MEDNSRRKSGVRPKKRKFRGNQYTNKKPKIDVKSASGKKLSTTNDNELCSSSKTFDGNLIIDKCILFRFLEDKLCCKTCNNEIKVTEKHIMGLSSKIVIECKSCENASVRNSKMLGSSNNIPEINKRIVYAMRCIGQGLQSIKTFCAVMDLHPPISQKSYDNICRTIEEAVTATAMESMQNAVNNEVSETASSDLTISGDCSWKTRGFSSQIGICSIIGSETGKVVDVEVSSLFCKGCDSWKGPRTGPNFATWLVAHEASCTKNHTGSSGKMEVEGMLRIFNRSESISGVRYVNYIGDGDSKTFCAIKETKPYGPVEVTKIECVGHVQKRMGSRLRRLKEKMKTVKLSDGKSLSGKGRLTDQVINQLTVYYGNAIRGNPTSLKKMREAIWAIYFHTRSTDDEPLHGFCPTGESSWCKFQQAEAKGLPFTHKNHLPLPVMEAIKPTFNALSHPDLLRRCLGAKTQNPNESFNQLVWKICPKVSNCGPSIAKIAAYDAVIVFNDGKKSRLIVMRKLGITTGKDAVSAHLKADFCRVQQAEYRAKQNTVEVRRIKRKEKLRRMKLNKKRKGQYMLLEHFRLMLMNFRDADKVLGGHVIGHDILVKPDTPLLVTPLNSIGDPDRYWPKGEVPYVMDPTLSTETKQLLLEAMKEFDNVTCVRYIPKTNEPRFLNFVNQPNITCYTEVGMAPSSGSPSGQPFNAGGLGCIYSKTIFQHMLMHPFGFWHEEMRQDRDDFIDIFYSNVKKGEGGAFVKLALYGYDYYQTPYDYNSKMQHGSLFFSKNGQRTMQTKKAEFMVSSQDKPGIDSIDIDRINKLYCCADKPCHLKYF